MGDKAVDARDAAVALSRFCEGLIAVRSERSYSHIESALDRVQSAIRRVASDPYNEFVAAVVQHTVVRVIDSILVAEIDAVFQQLAFTRAMECYATLIPLLREESLLADALSYAEGYRARGTFANREVMRNVIVPLVAANPSSETLLDIYQSALFAHPETEQIEVRLVTLYGLVYICESNLSSQNLVRLLQASLRLAGRDLSILATILPAVFSDILRGPRTLDARELNELEEVVREIEPLVGREGASRDGLQIIHEAIAAARQLIN